MKIFFRIQNLVVFFAAVTLFASFSITPNTRIKAIDIFFLGNNTHGSFSAKIKNVSTETLKMYHAPTDGSIYSAEPLKPSKSIKIRESKNTALVTANNSNIEVSIDFVIKADAGLSMGYKN